MHTEQHILQKIPVVYVYQHDIYQAAKNGTILFFHGLGASKDLQIHDLKNLAQHGFLVVGVDNIGHGQRRYHDFAEKFSSNNPNFEQNFQIAVEQTAAEVPELIEQLQDQKLIHRHNVGVAGISMGGFITYRTILESSKIKVAVSILGSPRWKLNSPTSPHLHIKSFLSTPILSMNAGQDSSVPAVHAQQFHQTLGKYSTSQHRYIEFPNSQHFMLEEDWKNLWQQMVEWFQKWLMT